MINNIELIKKSNFYKKFIEISKDQDVFLIMHILKRRKDNPAMIKDVSLIKSYTIYNEEDFEKCAISAIGYCNMHNARAYINPNIHDSKDAIYKIIKGATDRLINNNYKNIDGLFYEVADTCKCIEKYWIIDIDIDEPFWKIGAGISDVINNIKSLSDINIIPTKNGSHIITKPINYIDIITMCKNNGLSESFYQQLYNDIKKNNPTILYIP